jgi:uncharacterized protein
MIVTAISDLHGDASRFPLIADDLAAADIVLITGDVTHFGRRDAARKMIETLRAFNEKILAVPGNCDYPEVGAYLSEEEINLDDSHRVIDGIAFLGVGGSLPCPGGTPYEMSDDRMGKRLDAAAEGLDPALPLVLVTHQPPLDTGADRLGSGAHVGSATLRAFIEERAPLVCFSGHIHEARGTDSIGPTGIANPGPLGRGCHTFAVLSDKIETLEIRS